MLTIYNDIGERTNGVAVNTSEKKSEAGAA
jgi:hypothetical protein